MKHFKVKRIVTETIIVEAPTEYHAIRQAEYMSGFISRKPFKVEKIGSTASNPTKEEINKYEQGYFERLKKLRKQ